MTADKIKTLREGKGWTQVELARRLGITRNGVNSWEQGLSMPSPACLVDLAGVFSVSTDYLLGVDANAAINVTGLSDRDIAVLTVLVDRLRSHLDCREQKAACAKEILPAHFFMLTISTFWCIVCL